MKGHPYRQAFAARDLDRLLSLLADDVVLHSGVSHGADFEGRRSAATILAVVLDVFEDVEWTHDFGDEHSHVVVYDARVLDKPIKSTWLFDFDADGKIRELWIMNRPLTGLIALTEAIGQAIEGAALGGEVREVAERLGDLAARDLDPAAKRIVRDINSSTAEAPADGAHTANQASG